MKPNFRVIRGGNSLIQEVEISKNGASFSATLYAKPSQLLTQHELQSCLQLLGEGGAVNTDSAADELPKSEHTAIVSTGGNIVATGTIKGQRPIYAAGISRKSNHPFDPNLHELGYIAVSETHRGKGLAQIIVDHLLFAFHRPVLFISPNLEPIPKLPLFATTYNDGMKIVLKRAGFAAHGIEWKGVNGDKLNLWLLHP